MAAGQPYDSDEGRAYAAAITSLMCGEGYLQSAKTAAELGPFAGYQPNRDAFLEVIGMHRHAAYEVPAKGVPAELFKVSDGRVGRGARVRQGERLQERPGHRASRRPARSAS
jgi:ribonucleotide reductase alpha subunit